MIEFVCEHCSRKIRVKDEYAGKKGRCPHCKQMLTVPQPAVPNASDLITYECQICGKTLKSPKSAQGKIKECPHCSSFVEIPVPSTGADYQMSDSPLQLREKLSTQEVVQPRPDIIVKESSENTDQKPKRLLPVFLDIFLYPLSIAGILMLLLFAFGPLVLYPLTFLGCMGTLLYLGLVICLMAYMFWYLSLCILKTAEGEVRAPSILDEGMDTSVTDMIVQMLRTFLLIVICLMPSIIYRANTQTTDAVFWLILSIGIFFLPMMLLISIMFDSFWMVWNPRVMFGGMFSSFFNYVILVLTFYMPIGLYFYIGTIERERGNLGISLAINAFSIYLFMVSSHLLGWYFYKNEEKLYWDV